MPSFKVEGLEELGDFFDNLAAVPDAVIDAMLNAEADVAVDAQKRTADSMLHGEYWTGDLARSVTKGKVKGGKDGRSLTISFKGSRTRANTTTPNTEIAFVNEFGKRGQPARPFIKTANEQCADEAVAAAGKEYDKWLNTL